MSRIVSEERYFIFLVLQSEKQEWYDTEEMIESLKKEKSLATKPEEIMISKTEKKKSGELRWKLLQHL